jgi:hypothetical protein
MFLKKVFIPAKGALDSSCKLFLHARHNFLCLSKGHGIIAFMKNAIPVIPLISRYLPQFLDNHTGPV